MMRINRKAISLFLICAIILLQVFCLGSCGNKSQNNNDGTTPTPPNSGENNPSSTGNNEQTNTPGNETNDDNTKYVVRFITDDGIPITIKESKKGGAFNAPTPPRRIGYIFNGWIGDYSNITQNTDIIASYTNVSNITNAICADTVYSLCGSEFNVLIGIYGEVKFCGLDMDVTYDSDLLELIEVVDVDDCVIQNSSTNGVIHLNYVTTNNTTGEVTFINLKFKSKVTTKTETNLQINVNSMYSLDNGESLTPSEYQVLQNKIIIEEAHNEQ